MSRGDLRLRTWREPRALALSAVVMVVIALSCGDPTGPGPRPGQVGAVRFTYVFQNQLAGLTDSVVRLVLPHDSVRVRFRLSDSTDALDTVIAVPPVGARLEVQVPLPPEVGAAGEPMGVLVQVMASAADTVLRGTYGRLVVRPLPGGIGAPVEANLPMFYVPTGPPPARLVLTPATDSVRAGDSLSFSAQAYDAADTPLSAPHIVFRVDSANRIRLDEASGHGVALASRGVARVFAYALNGGVGDSAEVKVQPKPGTIVRLGEAELVAYPGAQLASQVTIRVVATDGLGMPAALVSFGPSAGGAVSPSAVLTDTLGRASATWTLGPAPGGQVLTVTSAEVEPHAILATAIPPAELHVAILTPPAAAITAGNPSPPAVVVEIQDSNGDRQHWFNDSLTIALSEGPADAALSGIVRSAAVAGRATFSSWSIDRAAPGYALTIGGVGVTAATSHTFEVRPRIRCPAPGDWRPSAGRHTRSALAGLGHRLGHRHRREPRGRSLRQRRARTGVRRRRCRDKRLCWAGCGGVDPGQRGWAPAAHALVARAPWLAPDRGRQRQRRCRSGDCVQLGCRYAPVNRRGDGGGRRRIRRAGSACHCAIHVVDHRFLEGNNYRDGARAGAGEWNRVDSGDRAVGVLGLGARGGRTACFGDPRARPPRPDACGRHQPGNGGGHRRAGSHDAGRGRCGVGDARRHSGDR